MLVRAPRAAYRWKPWCAATWQVAAGRNTRDNGAVCGVPLPAGLQNACKLPEPIYTGRQSRQSVTTTKTLRFEKDRWR